MISSKRSIPIYGGGVAVGLGVADGRGVAVGVGDAVGVGVRGAETPAEAGITT